MNWVVCGLGSERWDFRVYLLDRVCSGTYIPQLRMYPLLSGGKWIDGCQRYLV